MVRKMKFLLKLCVAISFCFLLFNQSCLAAGISSYKFYGFSRDNRYCAFETYGYHDGSGFAYSNIYIVNVDKNTYAVKPFVLVDTQEKYKDVVKLRQANMRIASRYFSKYKISGKVPGRMIFDRPQHKHYVKFRVGTRNYALRLIEKAHDDKKTELAKEKIFELQLIKPDKKVKVLQKDVNLPKSRGLAFKYDLLSGYVNGNKIAVFIQYASVGFEGADFTQMLVTGKLD